MKNKDFQKLRDLEFAIKRHRSNAFRGCQSKRTVKSIAKHCGMPLKHSRVFSVSVEKLKWSPHTYKAVNPNFNLNNAT
jgi:hypothetical protein